MMNCGKLLAGVIGGFIGLAAAPANAAPSEACDTATVQALAPPDTTVSFAAREFGGEQRERLDALPHARYCIDCKQKEEDGKR